MTSQPARRRNPLKLRASTTEPPPDVSADCQTRVLLSAKQTRNLRAVQVLLGHTKIESTVRHLGVHVEDALELAEATEV